MNLPETIKSFFNKGHERTRKAKFNISVSLFTIASTLIITFIIVPLTLNYIGKAEFGIWMSISAIINWFAFFDFGLGNGLRNKLSEALALKDPQLAKIYLSSASAIIALIAFTMFVLFFVAAHFISWNSALNTDLVPNNELYKIVITVFFFFCIGFVLNLVSSVLAALQRYALNDILALLAQLLGLLSVYILVKTTDSSLYYLCLVYGGKSAIIMLIGAIYLFSYGSLKPYRPSVKLVKFKIAAPLLNLGGKFFINQVFYLLTSQASVILVVQFFGPSDVTVFNLATKYITITSLIFIMVLNPFLTAFTEAYTKKEFEWIKNAIKKINYVWLLVSIGTIMLVVLYKWFFHLWVGDKVFVPFALIITLGLANIIGMRGSVYTLFLNGIGKIHLQIYILGLQAFLFIPLSYLFYKLNFGLSSIVLAQLLFYISNAVIFSKQYKKIIENNAIGIWAK